MIIQICRKENQSKIGLTSLRLIIRDIMNDRTMPQKIDAEQAIIGSMFLSEKALELITERLNKDMFYLDSHKKIFEVIKNLFDKKVPIDITTVTAELEKKKLLNQVGGVEYLTQIINVVPTAANADEYINIIEEKFLRRNLIEAGTEIANAGFSSTEEIGDILDEAEKKIFDGSADDSSRRVFRTEKVRMRMGVRLRPENDGLLCRMKIRETHKDE